MASPKAADEVKLIKNFINGEFLWTEKVLPSYNPATGKMHARVPDSSAEDVDDAVAAAKAAFPSWSKMPKQQRSDFLLRIAAKIEERLDAFAEAESRDQGKPVWLARSVDIPRAIYNFRFFAGSVLYHTEKSSQLELQKCVNYTTRTPLGVAGLITPWNLPLYLLTWKIAPALATGNTVVAKPSEFTSLTAFMLAEVMKEVGLPAGVCNLVFGLGPSVGSAMVQHPDVPLISFTGGTVTGKRISILAAPFQKRLSLELGGKNPGIVFDDVDIDHVAAETTRSSFTNQGEICLCTSRIYVHERIFEEFCTKLVASVRLMKVGPPHLPDTKVGALVSKEHLAKVQSYLQLAKEEGGKLLCGETVDPPLALPEENKEGYFFQPTVVVGLTDSSRCVQEEIFGPIICVMPFKTEEEVIARANGNQYGLAASVWTKDGGRAIRMAESIMAGTVWVNCWMVRDLNMPFGGMKASGTGRESAEDSLDFFTEAKTICIKFA